MGWKIYVRISLTYDYDKGMIQLAMPGYVRALLCYFQREKTKRGQDSPYTWTSTQYDNDNHILNYKHPADELYVINQKRLHIYFRKFLYYALAIYSNMLMELNSLAEVQKIWP